MKKSRTNKVEIAQWMKERILVLDGAMGTCIQGYNLSPDDFHPVLDIEKMDGCSVEQLNRRALEWLKAIEKHYGRKPIVYANPHYLNNVISPEITAAYPIWVANYKVSRPSVGGWKFWQFTDRALVRGAGSVDLNVMRGY